MMKRSSGAFRTLRQGEKAGGRRVPATRAAAEAGLQVERVSARTGSRALPGPPLSRSQACRKRLADESKITTVTRTWRIRSRFRSWIRIRICLVIRADEMLPKSSAITGKTSTLAASTSRCTQIENNAERKIVSRLVAAAFDSGNWKTPFRNGRRTTPPPSPVIVTSAPRKVPPSSRAAARCPSQSD